MTEYASGLFSSNNMPLNTSYRRQPSSLNSFSPLHDTLNVLWAQLEAPALCDAPSMNVRQHEADGRSESSARFSWKHPPHNDAKRDAGPHLI
jgi:hypothetical protein